jgi:hypothetical protein
MFSLTLSMTIILISILLVALAVAGIGIKMLVKKDGQFAGTCSSNNPLFRDQQGACGFCGARPDETCRT